ncbi:unnamed protein product [Spirodela intermedia]|uniref:Uncharacterized protein n=1 Tax=Spirodela intermedia TaxID=51605 RepID=A0A7I8LLR2_SPIIN|nr:unnamed protein product [Spirodela intermedia]
MTTPPPAFCPNVRPSGLSTSTSMFLDAPAVLALISSPLLPVRFLSPVFLTSATKGDTLLPSTKGAP